MSVILLLLLFPVKCIQEPFRFHIMKLMVYWILLPILSSIWIIPSLILLSKTSQYWGSILRACVTRKNQHEHNWYYGNNILHSFIIIIDCCVFYVDYKSRTNTNITSMSNGLQLAERVPPEINLRITLLPLSAKYSKLLPA